MKISQWTASKPDCKRWHVFGQQCIKEGCYPWPHLNCKVEEVYAVHLAYINYQIIRWYGQSEEEEVDSWLQNKLGDVSVALELSSMTTNMVCKLHLTNVQPINNADG